MRAAGIILGALLIAPTPAAAQIRLCSTGAGCGTGGLSPLDRRALSAMDPNPGHTLPRDVPDRLPDLPLPSGPKPWSRPETAGRSAYDPSLSFLPDSVPTRRAVYRPPCRCQKDGRFWLDAAYFLGTTRGDGVTDRDFRSGLSVGVGAWLNPCESVAGGGELFVLESDRVLFDDGPTAVNSRLDLIGAEANVFGKLWCREPLRVDAVAGYRFLRLAEDVTRTTPTGTDVLFGHEESENRFHGGQVGLTAEYATGDFLFRLAGLAAFGVNFQELAGDGGRVSFHDYTVVPEAAASVGYAFGEHVTGYVGYNFLYAGRVSRAGGAAGDFWVQGLTFGLRLRY